MNRGGEKKGDRVIKGVGEGGYNGGGRFKLRGTCTVASLWYWKLPAPTCERYGTIICTGSYADHLCM